jgi:hypothetical protein
MDPWPESERRSVHRAISLSSHLSDILRTHSRLAYYEETGRIGRRDDANDGICGLVEHVGGRALED